MLIFALAFWGSNFLFVFGRNEKKQKALSKLSGPPAPSSDGLEYAVEGRRCRRLWETATQNSRGAAWYFAVTLLKNLETKWQNIKP